MRLNPAATTPRTGRRWAPRAQLFLAVASGFALLGAAGCSSPSGAGGTVSGVITIAAVPGIDDAPLYLAEKDGLFAAAGLQHVLIKKESQENAAFSALRNNQAQIAATDYGNLLYAQAQNPSYRILANGYDAATGTLEVLTLPGSSIKSPSQLAGKTVGLPDGDILPNMPSGTPTSLEAAAATEALSTYLGSATSSVHWEAMPQGAEISALEAHHLQAILVGEPYITEAETAVGAVEVMDACSGPTANLPLSGYVAQGSWVRQNPAAVADFQSAIAKAQADAAMAGPVQQVLQQYAGMKPRYADLATIGTYPTTTSSAELDRVETLLWGQSMIKQEPSIVQMIVR